MRLEEQRGPNKPRIAHTVSESQRHNQLVNRLVKGTQKRCMGKLINKVAIAIALEHCMEGLGRWADADDVAMGQTDDGG